MRSDLFGTNLDSATTERFTLQNPRMLRVALDGDVMARQGAMIAYQGQVDFAYQGSGGVEKFLKKAFTNEGMSLMKVTGKGDVFFADPCVSGGLAVNHWTQLTLTRRGRGASRGGRGTREQGVGPRRRPSPVVRAQRPHQRGCLALARARATRCDGEVE